MMSKYWVGSRTYDIDVTVSLPPPHKPKASSEGLDLVIPFALTRSLGWVGCSGENGLEGTNNM